MWGVWGRLHVLSSSTGASDSEGQSGAKPSINPRWSFLAFNGSKTELLPTPPSLLLSLVSLKQRLVSPASFLSTLFLPILWRVLSKQVCSLWQGKSETEFTTATITAECYVTSWISPPTQWNICKLVKVPDPCRFLNLLNFRQICSWNHTSKLLFSGFCLHLYSVYLQFSCSPFPEL